MTRSIHVMRGRACENKFLFELCVKYIFNKMTTTKIIFFTQGYILTLYKFIDGKKCGNYEQTLPRLIQKPLGETNTTRVYLKGY